MALQKKQTLKSSKNCCLKKDCQSTVCNFSTASLTLYEYFFGTHKWPSDLLGSELNPITGFVLCLILLAANKKVPSPPVGTIKSAQSMFSSE